jgi:hypothetical protein
MKQTPVDQFDLSDVTLDDMRRAQETMADILKESNARDPLICQILSRSPHDQTNSRGI